MKRLLAIVMLLAAVTARCGLSTATEDFSQLPGAVIDYSPAASGIYLGSPSIVVLPNGDYIVSHDEFGPKSTEHTRAVSRILRSTDGGQSWGRISTVQGAFWSTLFYHRGALYLLGTDKHHGNPVIRRSINGGIAWTEPNSSATGLLRDNGEYACGPMPVVEHEGRLWRAMEWRNPPRAWGINYQAGMMSAPVDADLLKADNWTWSNFVPSARSWNGADMGAWLEGNAIVAPDGGLVNVLRVQTKSPREKAAIVRVSADGREASFDPATGFINFPGGAKKFTIRYDPESKLYWSLASIVHERHRNATPGSLRNALALTCSPDLRNWTVRTLLLYHPDTARHGFQYVDWVIEGDDIVAACRTAFDDEAGGAHNFHDSNFITFHRVAGFRKLTTADSVRLQERTKVTYEIDGVTLSGHGFEMAKFAEGERTNSNRKYVWKNVPAALKGSFTRVAGGETAAITVAAPHDTTLRLATAPSQPGISLEGWTRTPLSFAYNDKDDTQMVVYTREVKAGERIVIPQGNWSGGIVILPGAG